MARLTWQNVSNPDFSGVSQSYRTMSDMLGRATQSGMGIVDTYTKAHADAADRAIMERMLGVTDPAQFNAQQIIGGQGNRASLAMLERVGKQEDTLIDRGVTRDTHRQNQRTWDWNNTAQEQIQANTPAINELIARAAAGDEKSIAEMGRLGLRSDITRGLVEDGSAAITGNLNRDNTRQRMEIADYNQGRAVKQDQFTDTAAADAEALRQRGFGIDPRNDEWIINNMGWDPARTQRALGSTGRGGAAPSASSLISGAVGGGQTPRRAVPTSFDDAVSDVFEVEGGYVANDAGKGETNLGINTTANPDVDIKGLTPDKAKAVYRERYWDAIGADDMPAGIRAMAFDAAVNQGPALAKRWAQESDGDPEKYLALRRQHYSSLVQRNPEKYGQYADGWESRLQRFEGATGSRGRNPAVVANDTGMPDFMLPGRTQEQQAAEAVNAGLRRVLEPDIVSRENAATRDRLSGSQINTLIPQYEELLGANPSIVDAASALAERVGGDAGTLATQIREVVAQGGNGVNRINIAEAAAIVEASARGGTEGMDLWGLRDWVRGNSFGGGGAGAGTFSLDPNMAEALIADVTSGTTRGQIQSNETEARAQMQANAATQEVNTLMQAIQQAQAAKEAGRQGMDPLIQRLNRQLEQAALGARQAAESLAELQASSRPATPEPIARTVNGVPQPVPYSLDKLPTGV